MKTYWSAFLSLTLLLSLMSCGSEQFGVSPQSTASKPDAIASFRQASCSDHTKINPAVDILYVVDNSSSNHWISDKIKTAIKGTIGSISKDFDYRVVGIPLMETKDGNDDYQVLVKNPSTLSASVEPSKILSDASQFTFFSKAPLGPQPPEYNIPKEEGLKRIDEFLTAHANKLFRENAYLFIVLVSNGKDHEIEYLKKDDFDNYVPTQHKDVFDAKKARFLHWKEYLKSKQLRFFSVTANDKTNPNCGPGVYSSALSYGEMSLALFNSHSFSPDALKKMKNKTDHYDICGASEVGKVFIDVNETIQQIIIPHKYKYWPITFTETATGLNPKDIKVYKSTETTPPELLPASHWTYIPNPTGKSYDTRIEPSKGEPTTARHLIEFTSGNEVSHPYCIQVTSTSNLEYFGFVVLPKIPKLDSVVLKINGKPVSQSSTSGWSYIGQQTRNIKVNHNGFADTPVALRTGYMLQLNGADFYYKSGDSVEIFYVPATN